MIILICGPAISWENRTIQGRNRHLNVAVFVIMCYTYWMSREFTRKRVRERDNHTCFDCKKVWTEGRNFDVHHLNGFCGKKSKGYDKISEMGGLITLCHKCHFNRPEHKVKSTEYSNEHSSRKIQLSDMKVILEMRKSGMTLQAIGNQFSVCRQTINNTLDKIRCG